MNCEQKEINNKLIYKCGKYTVDLSKRTHVMGILNVTPDSFSDGGCYSDPGKAFDHALAMQEAGADFIDIGAESTRPGASPVAAEVQIKRIEPVLKRLVKKINIPVSIDTSDAVVAKKCLDLGASIINDVCALTRDNTLAKVIAEYKAGVILMHMDKTPADMQEDPRYKDVIKQIKSFLKEASDNALGNGIEKQNIMLDPGIGFGKTTEHNLQIIRKLEQFKSLDCPLLIGTSRKSFIGNVLKLPVGALLYRLPQEQM